MTSARTLCQNLLKHMEALSEQIAELEKELRMRQTGRGRFTFNDHSGGRSNLRHSDRGLGSLSGDLFQGSQFLRVSASRRL